MSSLLNELQRNNVRFVRVTWVDFANVVRYRVLPIAHFRNLLKSADESNSVRTEPIRPANADYLLSSGQILLGS